MEIEEYGTERICPYCKHEHGDSWECGLNHDGDGMEEECDECGKKFSVTMSITTEYTTRGLCKENNAEHNWEYFDFIAKKDGTRCYGRKCLTCGEHEFDVEEDKA